MEHEIGTSIADQSRYGNDGVIQSDGWSWETGGSFYERRYDVSYAGTLLRLKGQSYVSVPKATGPPWIRQVTVELWFSPMGSERQSLVVADGCFLGFSITKPAAGIVFYTRTETVEGGPFSTPTIALGAWHHLVAVYDGAKMRVFLNGIKSPNVYPQSGPIRWAEEPIYFGKGLLEYFEGGLDEVRLYARALSEDEILAHYRKTMDADVDVVTGIEWPHRELIRGGDPTRNQDTP